MELRKRIDELVARYSLEPKLKDVYVEGEIDKYILEWFLTTINRQDINIYTIDTVEVSEDVLQLYGLGIGSNRSRVIALSAKLAIILPPEIHILCLADRDHEDYIPTNVNNSFLVFTDYNSIELYLLKPSTIRKLFYLVLGGFPLTVEQIFKQVLSILEEVYLFQLTNQALGWNMQWIDFTRFIKIGSKISFDLKIFEKAYLIKNSRFPQLVFFNEKKEELRSLLKDEPGLRLGGHDLMELLYFLVKKLKKKRKFGDVATFAGSFMGCLEAQDIRKESLFKRVLSL